MSTMAGVQPLSVEVVGGLEDVQEALIRLKEGRYNSKLVIDVAAGGLTLVHSSNRQHEHDL
jgi:pectin methylesterase-like acyl-CoA thioesterase